MASAIIAGGYSKDSALSVENAENRPPAPEIAVRDARTSESRPLPEAAIASAPVQKVTMALRWNQAEGTSRIPVVNDSEVGFEIKGVQCTGNFYIAKFPGFVGPKSSDFIDIIFAAKANSTSSSDVIRLKTSMGEKTILISHRREAVANLSESRLSWSVGEVNSSKSVQLQILGGVTKLTKVRPMMGAVIVTKELADGLYQISVAPKSTDRAATFPVFLEFDPAVPGAAPIITCVIAAKN